MNIGDSVCIKDPDLDWNKITSIPKDVARFWLSQCHPNTIITSDGHSVREVPSKDWETGYGMVVGMTTKGRPIILTKSLDDTYNLHSYVA